MALNKNKNTKGKNIAENNKNKININKKDLIISTSSTVLRINKKFRIKNKFFNYNIF
jgi:hypothetical protein